MAISTDLLCSILRDLNITSAAIEASAIVSEDGLLLAGILPENVDADRLAALSAALLAQGERAAEQLERGCLDQVLIKTAKGYVLMSGVGVDAALTLMLGSAAELGLILLAVRRIAALLEGFVLKPPPRMGLISLPRK